MCARQNVNVCSSCKNNSKKPSGGRCIPSLNFTQQFCVPACALVSAFYRYSISFTQLQQEADARAARAAEERLQQQLQQAVQRNQQHQENMRRQRIEVCPVCGNQLCLCWLLSNFLTLVWFFFVFLFFSRVHIVAKCSSNIWLTLAAQGCLLDALGFGKHRH